MREVLVDDFRFPGVSNPAAVASVVDGPWSSKITKTAGTPTVAAASGFMVLTLDNTAEVQNLCFYMGDVLGYPVDKLIQVDIWAKLSASIAAAVSGAFGMASARNDTLASVADVAWFRFAGSNTIVLDGRDGTNSYSGISTGGQTLSTTVKRFTLSFKEGVNTKAGALSTGGKSNVIYSMDVVGGANPGLLRRVGVTQLFDLSNYTGNFQPFFQIQKTSNAATGTLSVQRVRISYRP